ncbi:MAG: NmrA family transcriptional regulator [Vulcanimicrobiaceae bacterium]
MERVILLSGAAIEYGKALGPLAEYFKKIEEAVKASGLQWTFLRAGEFAANALAWAPQIRSTGIVRDAYGDAATSPVHERDIAAVGVWALTNSQRAAGRSYLLHGAQSLTKRDKVRLIGEAIGKAPSFEQISAEQARQGMIAHGVPESLADAALGYQADCVRQPGPSSSTVEELLGRPALTFAQWAVHHAAAFRN